MQPTRDDIDPLYVSNNLFKQMEEQQRKRADCRQIVSPQQTKILARQDAIAHAGHLAAQGVSLRKLARDIARIKVRSGFTTTPIQMRIATRRAANKVARQSRKVNR